MHSATINTEGMNFTLKIGYASHESLQFGCILRPFTKHVYHASSLHGTVIH
jgi:fructose-1,6-bisphosphatase/inositol monophosphatase family enzyme